MKKLLFIALLLLSGISLYGQDVLEIIEKADAIFTGEKLYSLSRLTIVRGKKTLPIQIMDSYSMTIKDRMHTLSVYREPGRMKGTAYLMIEDDLWVRFSSTGRIRKLSSSAKKNSAGGSDFSYSDMGEGNRGIGDRYSAELLGSQDVEGADCWVVELIPLPDTDEPYDKLTAFVSKEEYQYLKIDYYEAGANIKSLFLWDFRPVGDIIYPFKVEMRSNAKDSKTLIETLEMEFNSPKVESRLFSTAYLETIR